MLLSSQSASGRKNIIGSSDEVGGLLISENEDSPGFRDTMLESRDSLKGSRRSIFFYMKLQYLFMFPHADEGCHTKIPLIKSKTPK